MTIDIDQLPIPAWNLRCPRCDYSLNGLPSHRCPECGLEFRMAETVPTWARLREPTYTGRELPFPDFGLMCKACREPLAGVTTYECAACKAPFDPDDFRPRGDWFARRQGFETPQDHAAWAALAESEIPYVQQDPPRPYTVIGRPIVYIPTEFYFDFQFALTKISAQRQQIEKAGARRDWKCASCGEANPGTFESCWNCGGEPGGAGLV